MGTSAISDILRAIRERLNLTIEDAACRSGINRGSLSRIERGEQRLDIHDARRLALAYDCSLAQIAPPDAVLEPRQRPRGKTARADKADTRTPAAVTP